MKIKLAILVGVFAVLYGCNSGETPVETVKSTGTESADKAKANDPVASNPNIPDNVKKNLVPK